MRRIFMAIVFMLLVESSSQSAEGPLSLKSAVLFALDHSPASHIAKTTQIVRDLEYKNTVAKLLPSVDLTTTNGLQNFFSYGGNNFLLASNPPAPWSSTLTLGVTETLYDNGQTLTAMTIADLNREFSALNYLKNRESVTLEVAKQFYNFSREVTLFEVRKQQLAILDKQFKTVSNQFLQGLKTKSDYLRLKTQVLRAQIEQTTAKKSIELSITQLWKLLGVGIDEVNRPNFRPILVERGNKIADLFPETAPEFQKTYDYRLTKVQNEINDKSVTLAKRRYWPQISVTGGVSYNNVNYINSEVPFTENGQFNWNALLTLQYNFWDWGTRRRDIEIAQYTREIQENTLNQGLLDSSAEINGLMIDFSRIRTNYKTNQELLTLEEESYRNMETQYRDGKMSYLDLITSLTSLLDARNQFYNSYFEALQKLAQVRYYQGSLYETVALQ